MQTVAQQIESRPYLAFDKHAFIRSPKMVSEKSELTFSDKHCMHITVHSTERCRWYIGRWCHNPAQLRQVLLRRGWNFCHGGRLPIPADLTWIVVKKMCDEKFATRYKEIRGGPPVNGFGGDTQHFQWERFKDSVAKAGGYLPFVAGLAYRSLVLGLESKHVAQEMGISPQNVRTQIFRLNSIAEKLRFETHRKHHSKGLRVRAEDRGVPCVLPKNFRCGDRIVWSAAVLNYIEQMREQRFTWAEIGTTLGIKTLGVRSYYIRRRRELGGSFRPHLEWSPELIQGIERMREQGVTWFEIAMVLGRSKNSILVSYYSMRRMNQLAKEKARLLTGPVNG